MISLGLFRDAEKQYLSALKQHSIVDIYLYLSKVYAKLDQPLNSISKLKEASEKFANETTILQAMARIQEVYEDNILLIKILYSISSSFGQIRL